MHYTGRLTWRCKEAHYSFKVIVITNPIHTSCYTQKSDICMSFPITSISLSVIETSSTESRINCLIVMMAASRREELHFIIALLKLEMKRIFCCVSDEYFKSFVRQTKLMVKKYSAFIVGLSTGSNVHPEWMWHWFYRPPRNATEHLKKWLFLSAITHFWQERCSCRLMLSTLFEDHGRQGCCIASCWFGWPPGRLIRAALMLSCNTAKPLF